MGPAAESTEDESRNRPFMLVPKATTLYTEEQGFQFLATKAGGEQENYGREDANHNSIHSSIPKEEAISGDFEVMNVILAGGTPFKEKSNRFRGRGINLHLNEESGCNDEISIHRSLSEAAWS
jgi:hypothetical protein